MALTRPTFNSISTRVVSLSDPLTVLHGGATSANVDVGFLINRANGLVSNVALYWNESGQSFVTAFTANTGATDTNVAVTSYANITTGALTITPGTALSSTNTTTGALVVTGGVGVSGNLYIGGNLSVAGNIISVNYETVTNTEYVNTIQASNLYAATIGNAGANGQFGFITATTINATTIGNAAATGQFGTVTATTLNAATIGNAAAVHTGSTLTLTSWANIAGPLVLVNNTSVNSLQITGTATKGGAGYHDFLSVTNQGGGTNPNKYFRVNSTGGLEIINSAYSSNVFTLTDDGNITIPGRATVNALYTTTGLFWAGNNNVISTGGGGATPAGLTGQVQYNNGGALGGSGLYYYSANSSMLVTGGISSTAETTGQLQVLGGIGVTGSVWAGQVYSTNNGNGTNYRVGDDAWLGDINVANTTRLMGAQDGTQGYLIFGSTNATNYIGRSGSNPITVTGTFAITGATQTAAITSSGTIVAATVNAATIGNTGASGQFGTITATTVNAATIGNTTTALVGATATLTGLVTATTINAATIGNAGASGQFGTITATTINAATIGNTGASLVGTVGASTLGAIPTANISLYDSVTAYTTNQAFYLQFSNIATTGNSVTGVAPSLAFNPGVGSGTLYTGTLVAATVNAATIGNASATLTGTLQTAAQTNITSVGTLTGLSMGGTLTFNNVLSPNTSTIQFGDGTGWTLRYMTNVAGTPTQRFSFNDLGAFSATGTVTGSQFNGSGAGLTSIPGANVTGTLSIPTTSYAATVSGAAQANITSVGTLTSLAVTGNITAGNLTGATLVSATNLTGTLTTASQTNITSVGTLTGLTTGTILPSANVTQNLGSTTAYWNNIYGLTFVGQSTSAKYADLAENYSADSDYPPGTVLVFGGTEEVTTTGTSHDTRVAGVVSTNPAYLMNSDATGVPVALTGRLPCRVQGPVNKGTVLVTSTTPGVAQAIDNTQFRPGCVLGKALESINTNSIATIEIVVGRH
jgi:hypothetical protein